MIKTGIIRRIDDLGRIAIPKEVRQNALRSKSRNVEGMPMEFFYENDGTIILKPYECLWERNPLDYSEIINPHVTKEGDFLMTAETKFCPFCGKEIRVIY